MHLTSRMYTFFDIMGVTGWKVSVCCGPLEWGGNNISEADGLVGPFIILVKYTIGNTTIFPLSGFASWWSCGTRWYHCHHLVYYLYMTGKLQAFRHNEWYDVYNDILDSLQSFGDCGGTKNGNNIRTHHITRSGGNLGGSLWKLQKGIKVSK